MTSFAPTAVRWVRLRVIRSELESPDDVRRVVKQIRASKNSKFRESEFEVHYDPRRKKRGQYDLVTMVPMEIPNPATCAECESHFEPSGDYLCLQCRQYADG